MNYRRIATVTGWLWIVTFVTSIPTRFVFYKPVIDHGNYVTGAGADAKTLIAIGAVLELILIISGTLVIFDVIEGGGSVQGLMSIPEAFWELSIGIYLIVKGYRTPAIARLESPAAVTTV